MANISEIREEIFNNNKTKRIIIRMRKHSANLTSQEIRDSAYSVANEIFPDWEHDSRVLFLAIEFWSDHTFLAIDINHHDYNFDTAHRSTTILPVFVLSKKRRTGWKLVRWPVGDKMLVEHLAHLHNVHGFDTPTPFLESHILGTAHANPRWLYE